MQTFQTQNQMWQNFTTKPGNPLELIKNLCDQEGSVVELSGSKKWILPEEKQSVLSMETSYNSVNHIGAFSLFY